MQRTANLQRIASLALLLCLPLLIGCQQVPGKSSLVYGESTISLSDAAGKANAGMTAAAGSGYRAVSVGGGVGVGIGDDSIGRVYTVLVVVEGPSSAPDLVPGTGVPVPTP